ncbi:MAG: FliI/YscN family ATPase [Pseudomonadota bacterium]
MTNEAFQLRDDASYLKTLASVSTLKKTGRIRNAFGVSVSATGVDARIGEICDIVDPLSGAAIPAEVVGIAAGETLLSPLAPLDCLSPDAAVIRRAADIDAPFGDALLGRVIDANGTPLDGLGPLTDLPGRPLYAPPPNPMARPPIDEAFSTGVRAVDGPLTLGVGQRIGVFAMAGVGKTTLLAMLAKNSAADVNVIALIGERGREVREFIDDVLGPEGLARSVIVVATSDRPARERSRAAYAAMAIAEGFRDAGSHALLLMDSVTRYARALREIGLSIGEPPVRRGLPPSVFAELPRLFERAGRTQTGAITGVFTVLVEDEDGDDPIGEETRSILDGHIVLSRKLAQAGHYPAIDIPASISRLYPRIAEPAHRKDGERLRAMIAKYEEISFLLQLGDYQEGADPLADDAVRKRDAVLSFLKQSVSERSAIEETRRALDALMQAGAVL